MSISLCVVCLSVCLRGYLRNHIRDLYQIFVHVAYGRGSVIIRCRCGKLCISGFVDDIVFFHFEIARKLK